MTTKMQLKVGEFRLKRYPKDFAVVRAFYEDKLGLPVSHEWDSGPANKGVMFSVGSTTLELLSPPDGYKPVQGADVSWEVTDVKGLWKQLKDNTPIAHDLRHNNWGDTSFQIIDPEGFHITFFTKDQ